MAAGTAITAGAAEYGYRQQRLARRPDVPWGGSDVLCRTHRGLYRFPRRESDLAAAVSTASPDWCDRGQHIDFDCQRGDDAFRRESGVCRRSEKLIRFLGLTGILGGIFLIVQGYEWVRLVHFGLTLSSSVYGGLFYTLIGFHGLHVVGALIWLLTVFVLAQRGRFSKERYVGLQTCGMYWTFVVGLWPVLYGLVYLL